MKLLANEVHMQGMEVLLADKVHKQEPQRVAICFTHATMLFDFCKKSFNKFLFVLFFQ